MSQRLVVELHASRLRLATASDLISPAEPPAAAAAAAADEGAGAGAEQDRQGPGQEEEEEEERVHEAAAFSSCCPLLPPRRGRIVGRPLVVGHRGASGHRTGNSLESFRHAVALGACVPGYLALRC